jgi:hypothetical protein
LSRHYRTSRRRTQANIASTEGNASANSL